MILGSGNECTLGTLTGEETCKLEGEVVLVESRTATQIDFGILENWVDVNFLKLNKGKCQVLSLGCNNPMQQYRIPTR